MGSCCRKEATEYGRGTVRRRCSGQRLLYYGSTESSEGLPPLDLATIKDFLRFIVATSRGIIDDKQKQVTVDSINTFTEWFFAGFARVTGHRIDGEDRRAVYDVSKGLSGGNVIKADWNFVSGPGTP